MTNKYDNPGIAYLLLQRKVKDLETVIDAKEAIIIGLREEIKTLKEGIHIAGWSCFYCEAFNSSEKEKLENCRCCGQIKRTKLMIDT